MPSIGPTTINLLRSKYKKEWGRDWPQTDLYLTELVTDAKKDMGFGPSSKVRNNKYRKSKDMLHSAVLDQMRSDDPTPMRCMA